MNTVTAGDQTEAAVAGAPLPGFVVTWVANDGDGRGVFARRFDASGNPLGGEIPVNTDTAGDQPVFFPPAVATSADGFIVAWDTSGGQNGSGAGVYARRFDAAGAPLGPPFLVNVHSDGLQFYPEIAAAPDGRCVVVWASFGQDGDGYGMFGRRYTSAGMPAGGEFQINTYTTNDQGFRSGIGMAPDGRFVVAWESFLQDGTAGGVYAQRYDAAGSPVGTEFRVNSSTDGNEVAPDVAVADDGSFVVTWRRVWDGVSQRGTFVQRYDATGAPLGVELEAKHGFTADALAGTSDGGFVIAWDSMPEPASLGIAAQRFTASATVHGPELRVNTYTTDLQRLPAAAALADGGFVIAWDSQLQDGSGFGIFAQRFAECGDGITSPGEGCDDGNLVVGDCCSARCTLDPPGTPCADDADPTTTDTCDAAGLCIHTHDRPIDAARLTLLNSGGREWLVFLSRDPSFLFPAIGGPDDPATGNPGGLSIDLFSQSGGTAHLAVPSGEGRPGWTVSSDRVDRYRWKNPDAPGGPSPVKTAILRQGKVLKIIAARSGLALTGPQGAVGIRVTTGRLRSCALFDSSTIRRDQPGRFVAREAEAAGLTDCTDAALTVTTTSTSTTTTTLPNCASASAPQCNGACPVGGACVDVGGGSCACTSVPCLSASCFCVRPGICPPCSAGGLCTLCGCVDEILCTVDLDCPAGGSCVDVSTCIPLS